MNEGPGTQNVLVVVVLILNPEFTCSITLDMSPNLYLLLPSARGSYFSKAVM